MTHTPGRWVVIPRRTRANGFEVKTDDGRCSIAEVFDTNGYDDGSATAPNAHLIAAAPDLLAACEDVASRYASDVGEFLRGLLAAIAKAKGTACDGDHISQRDPDACTVCRPAKRRA